MKFALNVREWIPKVCNIYPRNDNPTRCLIFVYKKYLSHRLENNCIKGHNAFYQAYIPNPKSNVRYKASPSGIHSILFVTKELANSLKHQPSKNSTKQTFQS